MDMPENNGGGSILDRVILSQQSDTLEHFNPVETVTELLKQLSQKEADVLRRRFGLGSNPPETLETIGQQYQVTRERVRQIQRWAIQRLSKTQQTRAILRGIDVLLQQLLEDHGGVMLEEDLLESLHSHAPESTHTRASTLFILEELLNDKFQRVVAKQMKPYWKSRFAAPDLLQPAIEAAVAVLREAGRPLPQEEFLTRFRASNFFQNIGNGLSSSAILSYLSVATAIDRNPFGEIGLREWGSVVPKRMNDKILMVLRKHGKPMHFQDITKKINEIGFDHRQAYPPTVHNELILNKEYVLVGRGIYALQEWGYKPGVVSDVIAAILRETGPLTRDEIVAKVLEQRMVKKNTIHLALTNKSMFQRDAEGRYSVTAGQQNENTHVRDHTSGVH